MERGEEGEEGEGVRQCWEHGGEEQARGRKKEGVKGAGGDSANLWSINY